MRAEVRKDVEAQGAALTDGELRHLVQLFVWGRLSYELANFNNTELARAITTLAIAIGIEDVGSVAWRRMLIEALKDARRDGEDISRVLKKTKINSSKPRHAALLLPDLMRRFEHEWFETRRLRTPVIRMLWEVYKAVHRLDGGSFSFETRIVGHSDPDPSEN